MVDDWGWGNVGYHLRESGSPLREIATPNIDALVKDGVELDRHYAYRWCAPSRSSFLSGRLPVHVFQGAAGGACNEYAGIPRGMTGLASKLAEVGYRTHQVGKWDAGLATREHIPVGRGFHSSLGYFDHCNDFFSYRAQSPFAGNVSTGGQNGPCHQNQTIKDLWDTDGPADAIMADSRMYEELLFAKRATEILDAHDPEVPLFLYYASHLAHVDPLNHLPVPQEWVDRFRFITDSPLRRQYHAMVSYMDDVVGNFTMILQRKQMWNHTLFVQSSDNGGPLYSGPLDSPAVNGGGATNYPLRGAKLSDWEGGVRVNAWVSGGFLPHSARGRKVDQFLHLADWYATFCLLAGADPADKRAGNFGLPPIDSINAWPLITGTSEVPLRSTLLLSSNTVVDTVAGWKLIVSNCTMAPQLECDVTSYNMWSPAVYPNLTQPNGMPWTVQPANCTMGCLFNILRDPGEQKELSAEEPVVKARLGAALAEAGRTQIHTPQVPDTDRCCAAATKYGGFLGPFVSDVLVSV